MKRFIISMLAVAILTSLFAVTAFATETEAVGGGVAVFVTDEPVDAEPEPTPAPTSPAPTPAPTTSTEKKPDTSGKGVSYSGEYGYILTPNEILGLTDENAVTTGDVQQWVDKKGGDIIAIVKKVAMVISVIGFFVSLIVIIVGAIGNRRAMVGGIIGLIVCCVVFVAAECGEYIMVFFSSWLKS